MVSQNEMTRYPTYLLKNVSSSAMTDQVLINLNDVRLPSASSVNLGVTLDSKLTWDLHMCINKARQSIKQIIYWG